MEKIALRPAKYFNLLASYNWTLSLFSTGPGRLTTYFKSLEYPPVCQYARKIMGFSQACCKGGSMKDTYCAFGMFPPPVSFAFLSPAQEVRFGPPGRGRAAGLCSPKPSPQALLPKLKQPHRELRKL